MAEILRQMVNFFLFYGSLRRFVVVLASCVGMYPPRPQPRAVSAGVISVCLRCAAGS